MYYIEKVILLMAQITPEFKLRIYVTEVLLFPILDLHIFLNRKYKDFSYVGTNEIYAVS